MSQNFGGDEIDRLLETEQNNYRSSYRDRSSRGDRDRIRYREEDRMKERHERFYGDNNRDRDRSRERHGRYNRDNNNNNNSRDINNRRNEYDNRRDRDNIRYNNPNHMDNEIALTRKERQEQDIERDQRTVFACQIHPKCDEKDIFLFFSEVGKVVDIQLIRDNRTFKSKGLCYVEFEDKASVPQALALSGQPLSGYPVSVQLTQAEKNRSALAESAERQRLQMELHKQQQSIPMKLYISNIHGKVTEEDIHPVFSAFGDVLSLEIKKDHRGKSKGYGYVEFKNQNDAIEAMNKLNDLEILGQKIKVAPSDPKQSRETLINESGRNHSSNDNKNDMIQSISYDTSQYKIPMNDLQVSKLEDESGNGGITLTGTAKLKLMEKLSRGTFDTSKFLDPTSNIKISNNSHNVSSYDHNDYSSHNTVSISHCVLLSNMFDPTHETNPDFDIEIREDVVEEVKKFGKLLHIFVDKTSRQGLVYLKFKEKKSAQKTVQSLNGRWFAKNQIKADFYPTDAYDKHFFPKKR